MNNSIIRRVMDGIEFFTINETGESGMSKSGLAMLCGVKPATIGKLIENLSSRNSPESLSRWHCENISVASTLKKGGRVCVLHTGFCKDVVRHYYTKGFCTPLGCDFISMPFVESVNRKELKHLAPKRSSTSSREKTINRRLLSALGGRSEVPTEAGNIDLLTSEQLIEIKEAKNWKCAIGQLIVYGLYYPSHQKRLHLFGAAHSTYLDIVRKHCEQVNIVLTVEA